MLNKTTKIINKLIEESNSIQEKKNLHKYQEKTHMLDGFATILTGLVILHINDLNPIRTTNSRARKMIHVKLKRKTARLSRDRSYDCTRIKVQRHISFVIASSTMAP